MIVSYDKLFIVLELGNSGAEHWQTYFEKSGDNFYRINQQEWDTPVCEEWIDTIDKRVSEFEPLSVVLRGHIVWVAQLLRTGW